MLNRFENADPPVDIRLGSYKISPAAKAEARYDDNIFVTERNRESDFIVNGGVGLKAQSDFQRHALDFYGDIDASHYISNDSEDYWEGTVGTRGRLDVQREIRLGADAWVRRATDPRDSPDNVNGSEPSVYRLYHGSTFIQAGVTGPFLSQFEFGVERVNYQPVPSSAGTIDTSDRDRDEYFGTGLVGYQYLGTQQVYMRVRGDQRVYDRERDNGGFERDSTGLRTDLGITMDLGGLMFADLSVGYQRRAFDDNRFGTVQRPVFAAALLWNPTGLTSVKLGAVNDFVESFNNPSPGYWRTLYELGVEHELRRDWILLAKLSLTDRDYERLDRSDMVYGADAGVRYRVDRGLFLEGEYKYRQQDSNVSDYYRNIAMVRVRRVF